MKFHLIRKNLQISSIIIQVLLYTILFSTTHSLRFRLSKTDDLLADAGVSSSKKPEEEISDKELEALLKDPKYAALAGDVFKSPSGGPSSSSSSKLDDSLAGLTDSAVDMKSLETSIKHKSSSLSKGKLDAKSSKDDPLDKMEMLSKSLGASDPMKDLDLLGGSGFDSKPSNDKKKEKKNEEEEKFKKFDFMTKQQARYLIEVLKQPVFYNMLPMEAQQIVNVCLI